MAGREDGGERGKGWRGRELYRGNPCVMFHCGPCQGDECRASRRSGSPPRTISLGAAPTHVTLMRRVREARGSGSESAVPIWAPAQILSVAPGLATRAHPHPPSRHSSTSAGYPVDTGAGARSAMALVRSPTALGVAHIKLIVALGPPKRPILLGNVSRRAHHDSTQVLVSPHALLPLTPRLSCRLMRRVR